MGGEGRGEPPSARELLRDLELLEAEMGAEALDGLWSMIDGGDDVSCLSVKKLRGRRDKFGGRRVNVFRR